MCDIGIAVSGCGRVEREKDENIERYGDLCRELKRLGGVRCSVLPVVVEAFKTIFKRLALYMALLDLSLLVETRVVFKS